MSHSRRLTTLHKRRTGHWAATGSDSGRTIPDGSGDEFDGGEEGDDDDNGSDDTDDDNQADPRVTKANEESRRRRQQNKLLRVEVAVRDVAADLELTKIQRKYVLKFFDPSSVEFKDGTPQGIKDAVTALVDDFNDEFGSGGDDDKLPKNLPGQGSAHNRAKGKGGQPSRTELQNKYTALRR